MPVQFWRSLNALSVECTLKSKQSQAQPSPPTLATESQLRLRADRKSGVPVRQPPARCATPFTGLSWHGSLTWLTRDTTLQGLPTRCEPKRSGRANRLQPNRQAKLPGLCRETIPTSEAWVWYEYSPLPSGTSLAAFQQRRVYGYFTRRSLSFRFKSMSEEKWTAGQGHKGRTCPL